jgi:RecJ-like exonuclease
MENTPTDMAPGDELPPDNANAAPNVCGRCGGSGRVEGERCDACGGTGEVVEAVGGG